MGSSSEIVWSPSGQTLVYPAKKMKGNEAAVSTNSDLYAYDVPTGLTVNLTSSNPGYDTDPQFSPDGQYLSWLSMARDGYEADLNRVALMNWNTRQTTYLNTELDRSAYEMSWSPDAKTLYYAVYHGGFTQIIAHSLQSPVQVQRSKPTMNSTAVLPWTVITLDTAQYSGLMTVAVPPSKSSKKSSPQADHWIFYLKSTMLRPSELCGRLRSSLAEKPSAPATTAYTKTCAWPGSKAVTFYPRMAKQSKPISYIRLILIRLNPIPRSCIAKEVLKA